MGAVTAAIVVGLPLVTAASAGAAHVRPHDDAPPPADPISALPAVGPVVGPVAAPVVHTVSNLVTPDANQTPPADTPQNKPTPDVPKDQKPAGSTDPSSNSNPAPQANPAPQTGPSSSGDSATPEGSVPQSGSACGANADLGCGGSAPAAKAPAEAKPTEAKPVKTQTTGAPKKHAARHATKTAEPAAKAAPEAATAHDSTPALPKTGAQVQNALALGTSFAVVGVFLAGPGRHRRRKLS
jgi:hypothetical protein